MTPKQLVTYYGSATEVAKQLNVTRQCVYNWLRLGRVSAGAQLKVQAATRGKLKAKAN